MSANAHRGLPRFADTRPGGPSRTNSPAPGATPKQPSRERQEQMLSSAQRNQYKTPFQSTQSTHQGTPLPPRRTAGRPQDFEDDETPVAVRRQPSFNTSSQQPERLASTSKSRPESQSRDRLMPSPNIRSPTTSMNQGSTARQLTFITSQLAGMTATVARLCEELATLKPLPAKVQELKSRVRVLEERLADFETAPTNVAQPALDDEAAKVEKDKVACGRMVRAAAELAYGCRPGSSDALKYPRDDAWPTLGEVEGEGDPAMRWDLDAALTADHNSRETNKLVNILKNQRSSVALPNDIPLESVPQYKEATNLYNAAITNFFKQLRNAFHREMLKEWGTVGREKVMAEIAELEKELLTAGEAGYDDIKSRIKEKKSFVKVTDKKAADAEEDVRGNVRSKAQGISKRIQQRRPLVETYSGPEWSGMDSQYAAIPLMCRKQPDDKLAYYWPVKDTVYSPAMLAAWDAIWDAKTPTTKGYTRGAVISEPDDTVEVEEAVPYLPSDWEFLHLAPQRWMFRRAWLIAHPELKDQIAPFDQPTDIEEVKNSEWVQNHPWRIRGKGGRKAGAKRGLSQDSSGMETGRNRSRSVSHTPSLQPVDEDDRDSQMAAFKNKKRRLNTTTAASSSQMSRTPENTGLVIPPGGFDEDEEPEQEDNEQEDGMNQGESFQESQFPTGTYTQSQTAYQPSQDPFRTSLQHDYNTFRQRQLQNNSTSRQPPGPTLYEPDHDDSGVMTDGSTYNPYQFTTNMQDQAANDKNPMNFNDFDETQFPNLMLSLDPKVIEQLGWK
ncbi:hypothetical protein HD553DRAFT_338643 [Filobasidium floriforme]|uniref:uncharacterized protein n=1 Tax=Filobasidium floriforme TaxID=5210 RepID=UPI001E8E973C|nr:uncharacterized protein HD553DRAFT_338643 [Filobasidium floriforme]KAH8090931.1 hypothetical protein HD553DRAFT_338643 [Filobasidium floriforme]